MRVSCSVFSWFVVLVMVSGCRFDYEPSQQGQLSTGFGGGRSSTAGDASTQGALAGLAAGNDVPVGGSGAQNNSSGGQTGGGAGHANTGSGGSVRNGLASGGMVQPSPSADAGAGGVGGSNGSLSSSDASGATAIAGGGGSDATGNANGGSTVDGLGGTSAMSSSGGGAVVGSGGTDTVGSAGSSGNGGSAGAGTLTNCQTSAYNGHTYELCGDKVSWGEAKALCESVSMQVVRVDDVDENQWLGTNAYNPSGTALGLWIGATDEAVEGDWCWSNGSLCSLFWRGDGTGTAQYGLYNAWYGGYPANFNWKLDCGYMDITTGSTFGWYDQACTSRVYVFACESI